MRLSSLLSVLRRIAPEALAESWDRVGLHVGFVDAEVRRAMLCIDLTEAVVTEAIEQKVDLVVAYHPPIFQPLDRLTDGESKQRVVLRAARAGVAVYSPHTALDAAEGGVNDWLADGVRGDDRRATVRPIVPHTPPPQFKLVTFVPPASADALRSALSRAGAGVIGHYSECSFGVVGQGTFKGDETTSPTIGEAGRFERVEELRMEMVVPRDRLEPTLATLHRVHPYETPAFDVYRLEPTGEEGRPVGAGRVVELSKSVPFSRVVSRVRKRLGLRQVRVAGERRGGVRKIGVCVGAGGSLLKAAGDVDLFITGEMRHHDLLGATERGTRILLAGHTETERPYLKTYLRRITRELGDGDGVTWRISQRDRAPLKSLP